MHKTAILTVSQVHSWVVVSIFTALCNRPHGPCPEHFCPCPSQTKSKPMKHQPLIPGPPHHPSFSPYEFDHSASGEHSHVGPFCISFSVVPSGPTRTWQWQWQNLFPFGDGMVNGINGLRHFAVFIHQGTLRLLPPGAVRDGAARNAGRRCWSFGFAFFGVHTQKWHCWVVWVFRPHHLRGPRVALALCVPTYSARGCQCLLV